MTDPTTARDRAIEVVSETIGFDRSAVEADMLASEIVAGLHARPEVLRALAGAPTADVAECEVTPYVNHDVTPREWTWECTCGTTGGPFATRRESEESSDRHLDPAPEGVDAADELDATAIERDKAARAVVQAARGVDSWTGPAQHRLKRATDALARAYEDGGRDR